MYNKIIIFILAVFSYISNFIIKKRTNLRKYSIYLAASGSEISNLFLEGLEKIKSFLKNNK